MCIVHIHMRVHIAISFICSWPLFLRSNIYVLSVYTYIRIKSIRIHVYVATALPHAGLHLWAEIYKCTYIYTYYVYTYRVYTLQPHLHTFQMYIHVYVLRMYVHIYISNASPHVNLCLRAVVYLSQMYVRIYVLYMYIYIHII